MEIRLMAVSRSRMCEGYPLAALIVGITATCCILPLAVHGGLPAGHDTIFHLFQAEQFDHGIRTGVFYPRWSAGSNNGYGGPNFIFYAPLSYYFISAVHFFVPSLVVSVIVVAWFGFFLSGMSMFHAAAGSFGRAGSIPAAVLYPLLPFHVLDLYVRGAIAAFLAFIWLPLIFLHLRNSLETGDNGVISPALSISYAGLILTHLASGFIFTTVIGLYLIYHSLLSKRTNLVKVFLSLAIGLGLSAFYIIPLAYETKFIHINYIVSSPVGDYRKNFLFTQGLNQARLSGFYFLLHAGVVLEAVLFIFIMLSVRSRRILSASHYYSFFVLLFCGAFFLITPLSAFLWRILPGFSELQFPWRWIGAMEISLCFLMAAYVSGAGAGRIFTPAEEKARKRRAIFLIITLSVVSFFTISGSRILDEKSLQAMISPDRIGQYMEPVVEYMPIWTLDTGEVLSRAKRKVSPVKGAVFSRIVEWKSEERVIDLEAATPGILRIPTFYYPGWRAWLDNGRVPIGVENGTGAMLVSVPEGVHTLKVRFGGTPVRHVSWIISLISSVALIVMAGIGLDRGRKHIVQIN